MSKALVIAYAVHETGRREVIGLDVGEIESEAFWREFLRGLRRRGLDGVRLCVSDSHEGLKNAIVRVNAVPEGARAPEAVVTAISVANLIVLSPGSLFTSTIAALLGGGVPEAVAEFTGPVVYVANLMTQPGETHGFTVSEHLEAITRHVGPIVTDVLVDAEPVPAWLRRRYGEEGAEPVHVDREAIARLGVRLHEAVLHATSGQRVRHDPERLAREILTLAPHRGSRAG